MHKIDTMKQSIMNNKKNNTNTMRTIKIFIVILIATVMGGMYQEVNAQGCNPVLTGVNIMNRPSYCMSNINDAVELEIQWGMVTTNLGCVAPVNSWAIKVDMPTNFVYRVTSVVDVVVSGPFTWTYDGFNNSLRGINNTDISWGTSGTVKIMLKGNSPLHTSCADIGTVVNIQIIPNPPLGTGNTARFDNEVSDDTGIFGLEVREPMVVSSVPMAACYDTEAAALADAIAKVTATSTCSGTVSKNAVRSGPDDCSATITVNISNDCGDVDVVTFTNVRIDNTPPTVTAGTIASSYPTVAAAEAAAIAATGATDNCPGTINLSASTSGTCTAVITVTATDGCGKSSSITYNTRIDDTAPTVTAGSIASCYPTVAAAETAALAATSASDNCPGTITFAASTSGTCTAVVTVTATDGCGKSSSVTYNTRIDDTAPTFTRPMDITIYRDATCGASIATSFTGDVTNETDNCGVGQATFTDVVDNTDPCNVVITRTWSLVDNCGNPAAATQVQTITIKDNTPPTFTKPADITIYRDATCGFDATVAATGDVTNEADNCGIGQATFTDAVDNTNPCNVVITRTWSLVDNCGNPAAATQVQTITVRDNTLPVVSSIPGAGASIAGYSCGATVTINSDPNACSATRSIVKPLWVDNCTAMVTSTASAGAVTLTDFGTYVSGIFPVGMTTLTFSGTDACGNTGTCTLIIDVKDMQLPTISGCPANITASATTNACTHIVTWAAPTFFDNCGFTVVQTSSPTAGLSSGSAFPLGVTTILYTVTDPNGNSATCSFTITVSGTCNPVTEFTTTFVIESSGYSVGQTRTGIYTIDNIGNSANTNPIQVIINKPTASTFTTSFATINSSVTLFGNTFMSNNGSWSITAQNSTQIFLSFNGTLNPGQSSLLAISFTAVGITGSTGRTTSQLLTGTAGDQNGQNNFAQSTFLIN